MIVESIVTAAASALLPAIGAGLRGLFARWTGGAGVKPQSVEEAIQLLNADTARLQALAQLDQAGNVHMWVNDVRALQRPAAVVGVLVALGVAAGVGAGEPVMMRLGFLVEAVVFYLFGDRSLAYAARGGR